MSVPWRAVAGLLFVAAGLAGCSDPAATADEAPTPDTALPDGAGGLGLPTWAVGDAWTYRLNGDEVTYVLTRDEGADWIMETDSPERSFSDLRDDVSRLGPQRKSDLAGSQGDERVQFFRWPLAEGLSWDTRWDHQDVRIQVTAATPDRVDLEARDQDGQRVYAYTYDPAAGWFGELHHYAPDGSEMVGLTLTRAVHDWTGTVVHWQLDEVIADAGNGTAMPLVAGPFEVPAGATDLWADYHFTCTGTGGFSVVVQPANPGVAGQQGMQDTGPCAQVDWTGPAVASPSPGTWTFAITAGGQTVAYDYTLLVRTRLDVPFGAP